ncbi:MAG: glutathione S-transferase family protein [Novosphingobium sp.]|nr:glutathione S-transferase family protein [Novosphingobium sp.]
MARYTFFTIPMSRGQIVRWALHEAGADYATVLVDFAKGSPELEAVNSMRKVPTLVDHGVDHAGGTDRVVTEAAAICVYLAETEPAAQLAPIDAERADYWRWMFFAAGPIEQAVVARSMGWEVPEGREGMVGFGSFDRTLDTLDQHLTANAYVCGDRFTMADVYLGSQVDWGLAFGSIPSRPSFEAYAERFRAREAYKAAKAIDNALIEAAHQQG